MYLLYLWLIRLSESFVLPVEVQMIVSTQSIQIEDCYLDNIRDNMYIR